MTTNDSASSSDSRSNRRFKALLIDLSGTIHIDDAIVGDSISSVAKLGSHRSGAMDNTVKFKFVTNTTKESNSALHDRLLRLGFPIAKDSIFSSLTAARRYIEDSNLRPHLMVDDKAQEDFAGLNCSDPNCVIIGLAPEKFNLPEMNEAFNLLINGAKLIAIHKARYYKREDGLALGPGPFVAALEFATDTHAVVLGKPEGNFFKKALEDLNVSPEDAVMIGDDVRDDIDGAQKIGIAGVLVKTGKYRKGDEFKISPPPWLTCNDFSEAVNILLEHHV